MKKNHLIIIGVVVGIGVIAYMVYNNKPSTVVVKNQDGSPKNTIKTKSGKTTTTVNINGDYIDGSTLYDSKGNVIATLSNDATDANGYAKAVFDDENSNFIASPDGSLLSNPSGDGVTYVSPNGTVYLNQQ